MMGISTSNLKLPASGSLQAGASQLKLLALMEATTVTGAAKSMLDFCRSARDLQSELPGLPVIETSIITFVRTGHNTAGHQPELKEPAGGSPSESPNEFVRAARDIGVEVELIEERFRFDPRVISDLREIIERRQPDIVLTHHVKSHFLMKCSRLWKKYTWVAFHHGYTTTDMKMRAYNYLDRWSLPTANRVITVCEAFARELSSIGVVPRKRISVQHNSITKGPTVSATQTQALKAELNLGEDEYVVLAVGRLSREKAHADLVTAFAHLLRDKPEINARLVIIGDGPERGPLEAAAEALGIKERIIFTGQLIDVTAYYALADVMVLPSHSEGSPYVLLEAMAAGLPVVATSVGGVPEIVKDKESALLVPARSPEQMATAIGRVLTDPQLRQTLVANASRLVATRYSPESYLSSLVGVYQDILSSVAADAGSQTV